MVYVIVFFVTLFLYLWSMDRLLKEQPRIHGCRYCSGPVYLKDKPLCCECDEKRKDIVKRELDKNV